MVFCLHMPIQFKDFQYDVVKVHGKLYLKPVKKQLKEYKLTLYFIF